MKNTRLLLLVIMLCFVLMLAACGNSAPQPADTPPAGENEPAPAQIQEPATDQELTILSGTDFSSFDPQFCTDNGTESFNKNIYSYLTKFDKDMNIVGDLAESWEVSDDGLVWTIKLKSGIMFHDGTPFTAEAVKVTFERILDPNVGSPNRSVLAMISEVNVIDDNTVEIVNSVPSGSFLAQLAHPASAIISPAALEKYGENYATNPVGTGPFKFVEWQVGDHATIARNDDYFGGPPALASVVYLVVPDNSTRALLLQSGGGDIAMRLPTTEVERLESDPNIVVEKSDTVLSMYVTLNHSKESPLQDIRVRKALNYAVDREAIINDILGGLARPADAPITSSTWGYAPVGGYNYDLDKAKALLAEAGYENGIDLSIWCTVGRYQMDTQVVEVLQGQWAKAGIRVTIQQWETQALFALITNGEPGEFDMIYLGWSPSNCDAGRGLDPFSSTEVTYNYARYNNPVVDKMLADAKMETNLDNRAAMYKDVQKIIMEDAPWVFLYDNRQVVTYSNKISGLVIQPTEHILLKDVVKTP